MPIIRPGLGQNPLDLFNFFVSELKQALFGQADPPPRNACQNGEANLGNPSNEALGLQVTRLLKIVVGHVLQ